MSGRYFPGGYFPTGYFPPGYWPGGLDAGGYNIYRGTPTVDDIDYDTPVGYVPPGVAAIGLAGLGHTADVEYWYAIRTKSTAGVEETNTTKIVRVMVDDQGDLVGPPPNPIAWALATPAAGGKMTITYRYDSAGQQGTAVSLQIAEITAGVPDWDSLIDTIPITSRRHTPTASWDHDATVELAVRALSDEDVAGPAYTLDSAVADSEGPNPLPFLELTQEGA